MITSHQNNSFKNNNYQNSTYLRANRLSYHHPDGDWQFKSLQFSVAQGVYGLVGNNGSGKSLLCSLLLKQNSPTLGNIEIQGQVGWLDQQHDSNTIDQSIAQYLGLESALIALERIEKGSVEQADFDLVNDRWDLRNELSKELTELRLPPDPYSSVQTLSGGELTRLRLWVLFLENPDILILDEPSNHLDASGKCWLCNQLTQYQGKALVVSHDRELLNSVDGIFELSSLGIQFYSGNYDTYVQIRDREQASIARKLEETEKQQKLAAKKAQSDHEKAQKRAAQGNKLRKSGSQDKMILDAAKNSAQKSNSAKREMHRQRQSELSELKKQLQSKQSSSHALTLSFESHRQKNQRLLHLQQCTLPYGTEKPINWEVFSGDKWRIDGDNGKGKSTLLKCIFGELTFTSGQCSAKKSLYVDQHFSLLGEAHPLMDLVSIHLPHLTHGEIRNLLAAIGFKRDSVFRVSHQLSGGEKMKLALLIASHQAEPCLLLLDEPDNHLDLNSKRIFANTLRDYSAGFVLVTHDSYFARESGIESTLTI
ncbi:ATP-binding cassette domain-containing protein [Vibrio penaeicida]|uniref:ABC transporter ATP-binding protein n=1 Tax=Vibrio penaeicida TaxID=104609 RepID=A0AAV5NPH7_9VIBR|nr:ATP-binding cassette domain-containing protein [Vibrio penaeicida]RTZ18584.1 ABC-F family ATP-binding cassette domain-containing protein [Vibrio penaeicida]GLQ72162.1 ABC transporter ATP-binding protein [Vibrio penaeicida]